MDEKQRVELIECLRHRKRMALWSIKIRLRYEYEGESGEMMDATEDFRDTIERIDRKLLALGGDLEIVARP